MTLGGNQTAESDANSGGSGRRGPAFVVGIGASAGGLEALEQFFSSIPASTGICFVVIQHLSPDYKSLMVELLGKRAALTIRIASDGVTLEADTAYVIPPGKNIELKGMTLVVTDQESKQVPHLPVDIFFKCLATEVGERAVGIVLSGTGSDGTRGVREIKNAGGMIMVQSEASAKFDGMPKSAEATGVADFVLRPEKMGAHLLAYVNRLKGPAAPEQTGLVSDEEAKLRLFARIRERHKVDFTYYRMSTVLRRIQRRMGINRIDQVAEYLTLLEKDVAEVDALYRELLIGVTSFFRDKEAFSVLRSHWTSRLKEGDQKPVLRCWVAGCSTGEEAYSLAITLLEVIRETGSSATLKVFATDIDSAALAKAALGRYPESIAADIDRALLSRYFVRKEQDFQVARGLREQIVFAHHDLVRDPPFTNIDIISCRNLLIYLQPVLQRKVLEHMNFALAEEGTLLLGSSETVGELIDDFYAPLDLKWKLYRSRGNRRVPSPMLRAEPKAPILPKLHFSRDPLTVRPDHEEQILTRFMSSAGSEYMPLVLIVNEAMQLVHLIGEPGEFVRLQPGKTTVSLTSLVASDLSMPMTTGVQKAFSGEGEVRYENVRVHCQETLHICQLRILKLTNVRGAEPLVAVVVESGPVSARQERATEFGSAAVTFDMDSEQNRLIEDLQQELQHTRENLQATIEELETANEELQATNEELMASNEELQSTNEELQSVNEELHTVNAEYQEKILELTELNNDLENLFDNTDAAVLFLDEDQKIRKMNEQMATLLVDSSASSGGSFRAQDLGLQIEELGERIREANESDRPWEGPAECRNGRCYLVRVRPYHLSIEVTAGVTLTLVDVTTLVEAQSELLESRERYRNLIEEMSDGVVVYEVGEAVRVLEINRAGREMGGVSEDQALPARIDELWPKVEQFGVVAAATEVHRTGVPTVQTASLYQDDRVQLWVKSRFYRIPSGEVVGIYTDVTRQETLLTSLRENREWVWEWDTTTNRIAGGLCRFRLLGFDAGAAESAMDHWLSLIHPGDRAETSRLLDLLVSGSCNRVKLTHRFGAKNGGYQRFTDVAVVSARDATGRPAKVLGWVDSGQESGSCDG